MLLAAIFKNDVELAADLLVSAAREADAARLGDAFQPCGDVDAVAKNVVVFDDNVADIDADTQRDALVLRLSGVALGHAVLNFDGATHGVDGAGELDQDSVAGPLDDAAAVLGDLRVDQEFAPMRLKPRQRAFLIGPHQAAVTHHVCRQNGRQPSFYSLASHSFALPTD